MRTLATIVVVLFGLHFAAPVLVPVLLAAFFANALAPVLRWLRRKRVPDVLAIFITLFAALGAIAAFGSGVGAAVVGFSESLPDYSSRFDDVRRDFVVWLAEHGFRGPAASVRHYDPSDLVSSYVAPALNTFADVVTSGFFVILICGFILLEASSFPRKLARLGPDWEARLRGVGVRSKAIQSYLLVKTLTSLATGILVALWGLLFGLDHVVLWGVIAFVLNYVPNVGSVVAAIPPVLVALLVSGPFAALGVASGYFVINLVIGNILEPKILGGTVGLSELVVVLSIFFWGFILGPVGAVLSVPLTMIVRMALAGTRHEWLSILLGPAAPSGDRRERTTVRILRGEEVEV